MKLFHGGPGFVKRSLGEGDFVVLVVPARRVADAGVDVFQGDGEVNNEQVKVVDSVVLKLLLANGTNTLLVVE